VPVRAIATAPLLKIAVLPGLELGESQQVVEAALQASLCCGVL